MTENVSPSAQQAIDNSIYYGKALFKFISPNDVGKTGGHQCGFLLPKGAWKIYTTNPPEKITAEHNPKENVCIKWQDGFETQSVITWYGRKTRSEYRLTRFGKDFPYLKPDKTGSLLALIPTSEKNFLGYVLDTDADFEAIEMSLGISLHNGWALYDRTNPQDSETEDECVNRHFTSLLAKFKVFPSSKEMSSAVQAILEECFKSISSQESDKRLLKLIDLEYLLFRKLEESICLCQIQKPFQSLEEFLNTAGTILNRRKSRAGKSLENHVAYLLKKSQIPFESQPDVDGNPDIIIPSAQAYKDRSFPDDKLIVLGLKTTCKDRWRQVLNEAKRIQQKHLLTLQKGISENQLSEMKSAGVTLIVPSMIQMEYPAACRSSILSLEKFINQAKAAHG